MGAGRIHPSHELAGMLVIECRLVTVNTTMPAIATVPSNGTTFSRTGRPPGLLRRVKKIHAAKLDTPSRNMIPTAASAADQKNNDSRSNGSTAHITVTASPISDWACDATTRAPT